KAQDCKAQDGKAQDDTPPENRITPARALAAAANLAAIPPQVLPKFNARGGGPRPFRNAPFTAHSRGKWKLTAKTNIIAANPYRRKCIDRSFNRHRQANRSKECAMTKLTKTLTALAAAPTLAVAAAGAPPPAPTPRGR